MNESMQYYIISLLVQKPSLINNLYVDEYFYSKYYKDILQVVIDEYYENNDIDVKTILRKHNELDPIAQTCLLDDSFVANESRLNHFQKLLIEEYKEHSIKENYNKLQKGYITQEEYCEEIVKITSIYANSHKENISAEEIYQMGTKKKKLLKFNKFSQFTTELGMRENVLNVIAARPGVGKTALVLNMLNDLADNPDYQIVYFSYEMGEEEIIQRLIGINGAVKIRDLEREDFEKNDNLVVAAKKASLNIQRKNIYVYHDFDTTSAMASQIRTIQALTNKHIIFVIDTINYLKPSQKTSSEYEKLTEATRYCQLLTKRLDCTCFLLAHIQREGDVKSMDCIKGSGEIEQSSHLILSLTELQTNEDYHTSLNEIYCLKNRSGAKYNYRLSFDKETQRMELI